MKYLTNLILIALLIIGVNSYAFIEDPVKKDDPNDDGKGKIVGTIVDKDTETPMEFANIAVYKETDSTLVTGGITNEKGVFEITNLDYGDYYLVANFIGFNEENVVDIFEKASYLNGDDKWVTPIYLSIRLPADQAAAMQQSIIPVLTERINTLAPIIAVLRGRSAKKVAAAKIVTESGVAPKAEQSVPVQVLEQPIRPLSKEEFTYVSELKPLHAQRGFINMTPEYWPFFAINARTESRPVTVIAGDMRDEDSAVWRLQPNDLARLVLGPQAHRWLDDNFVPGDYVQITATRIGDSEIHIVLDALS